MRARRPIPASTIWYARWRRSWIRSSATARDALLVPERLDRIQGRRAAGRPHAESHANDRGEEERHHHRRETDRRRPAERLLEDERGPRAEDDSDDSAQQAEHDRLDQELGEDVGLRR